MPRHTRLFPFHSLFDLGLPFFSLLLHSQLFSPLFICMFATLILSPLSVCHGVYRRKEFYVANLRGGLRTSVRRLVRLRMW
jgi:hypothetical protein